MAADARRNAVFACTDAGRTVSGAEIVGTAGAPARQRVGQMRQILQPEGAALYSAPTDVRKFRLSASRPSISRTSCRARNCPRTVRKNLSIFPLPDSILAVRARLRPRHPFPLRSRKAVRKWIRSQDRAA